MEDTPKRKSVYVPSPERVQRMRREREQRAKRNKEATERIKRGARMGEVEK